MGGAPVHLRGSVSKWTEKPVLDIALNGENVLLFRTVGFVLRADADLKLVGSVDALTVTGDLSTRDSRYTRDFDLLSIGKSGSAAPSVTRGRALFELDAPLDTMTFDVRLRSGEPFLIRNNVVRTSLRPELTLGGTGAVPLLRGTIFVDPGRVSLPTGTAYVRSGRIDYKAADPFVPDIEGLAEMRLQGYDITMRVSGDLEEPVIDVSSLPPLSREDLMLLVLTNRPPGEQLTLKSGQRAAADVAAYIARDVISNWFDHGVTDADESWADSLEVETGQEVSDTGVDTVRARLRLLKGRLGEGADIYLTGERDVYDHYNFGLRLLFRFQ
jgi:translocation and assembly module TamB